ncbi:MAG TPA: hypothetical protein VGL40_03415 [Bacillota bacterium]
MAIPEPVAPPTPEAPPKPHWSSALPIRVVRSLPRREKRLIWRRWFKYRRASIPGDNRREKRQNWRALWGLLRTPNRR